MGKRPFDDAGELVRRARARAGLRVEELADELSFDLSFLCGIECGVERPSVDGAVRLMDRLNMPADERSAACNNWEEPDRRMVEAWLWAAKSAESPQGEG